MNECGLPVWENIFRASVRVSKTEEHTRVPIAAESRRLHVSLARVEAGPSVAHRLK
jgi:hypothetical protein